MAMNIISNAIGAKFTKCVLECDTIHNYVGDDNIIRKGAVSAKLGERFILPLNMRDGALLCVGKGNPDWNNSAPHGAGRLMSRRDAKSTLSMPEYKKTMKGIYSTSVSVSTLDESPMAYKDSDMIRNSLDPTADVLLHVRPILNIKDV